MVNKGQMLPPLTPEMVTAAELTLGLVLPADFLRMLSIQNGGVVADTWDACPIESNSAADDYASLEVVSGIGPPGQTGIITVLDTPYLVQEWSLPTPVVLFNGDGHTWTALDYRACGPTGEPSVCWIDTEMHHDIQLAPSFRAFVERLTASAGFWS